MTSVLLAIHLMIVLAIIILVLLQRSEGGGLGMGGGSSNSFMSARGTANAMSRATAILAGAFFCTSLALAYVAGMAQPARKVIDTPSTTAPAVPSQGGILDTLKNQAPAPK
jgi:preprotein translocase subunit SecG